MLPEINNGLWNLLATSPLFRSLLRFLRIQEFFSCEIFSDFHRSFTFLLLLNFTKIKKKDEKNNYQNETNSSY